MLQPHSLVCSCGGDYKVDRVGTQFLDADKEGRPIVLISCDRMQCDRCGHELYARFSQTGVYFMQESFKMAKKRAEENGKIVERKTLRRRSEKRGGGK
jgi:late competence protein required for DNA uptake (superfamily II DNA/RNA helicase)